MRTGGTDRTIIALRKVIMMLGVLIILFIVACHYLFRIKPNYTELHREVAELQQEMRGVKDSVKELKRGTK